VCLQVGAVLCGELLHERLEVLTVACELERFGAADFLIDFGIVLTPGGHFIGAFSAIHLMTVRESGVAIDEMGVSLIIERNASLR
jgi:hypothetical protein